MNKEDYSKYYIQGSDHYLIPKDVFDELFDEMENWREEAKELKKQLEELDKKLFFTKNELEMRQKSIDNKLNQQKEFIEYLENEIKNQKSEIFSNSLTELIIGSIPKF